MFPIILIFVVAPLFVYFALAICTLMQSWWAYFGLVIIGAYALTHVLARLSGFTGQTAEIAEALHGAYIWGYVGTNLLAAACGIPIRSSMGRRAAGA